MEVILSQQHFHLLKAFHKNDGDLVEPTGKEIGNAFPDLKETVVFTLVCIGVDNLHFLHISWR